MRASVALLGLRLWKKLGEGPRLGGGACREGAMARSSWRQFWSALNLVAVLAAGTVLASVGAWAQPTTGDWGAYEIYQAQPGDTVENIAARFGVAPELIRNLNALSDPAALVPGQALAIPLPGPPRTRTPAEPGPSPSQMRPARYGLTTQEVAITSEPEGGRLLYRVAAGTRLVVRMEQGSQWGVVMVDGSIGWVAKSSLEVTDEAISNDELARMLRGGRPDIAQEALRYLGTPYRYGGDLPYDVDCSRLVQAACSARGLRLPRTAAAQYEVGRPVNFNELAPGDRLYFVSRSGRINHTGIYLGNSQFIHASSRRGQVGIDSLADRSYWSRFVGARRF